ncbi:Flotillin-1 [Hordeum vulgare]|nr:Flotillin-1 [Hordeum vulgare]
MKEFFDAQNVRGIDRSERSLRSRWSTINSDCQKWAAAQKAVDKLNPSGANEDDRGPPWWRSTWLEDISMNEAELAMEKAGWDKQDQGAEVKAAKAVAIREAELEMDVERKNAMRQTEKLNAEKLSKAKAIMQYEPQVQESNILV